MVGGGLSLKKSLALTFKLLKKSKSESDGRNYYSSGPVPFIARHPSELDIYQDLRSQDKLKFTSFLGDPPSDLPLSPTETPPKDNASVSQYLSAIRELSGKGEPIFIFSEQPLDSDDIVEQARKSLEFSNPMYQTLAECLSGASGLSPELEEEREKMNDENVHYQVVVSNMPVFVDEKIYANLGKNVEDEPLYAVSNLSKDVDEIYANIELPIEPIIRQQEKMLDKDIFETVLYCTLSNNTSPSGLPNCENLRRKSVDSGVCLLDSQARVGSPKSQIIETNNFCLTPNHNQVIPEDKSEDLHSLITDKAAKTAFMQKLDSQLRSQIKKRVQFAVPECTAYSLEAYSSVEGSSLKQNSIASSPVSSVSSENKAGSIEQDSLDGHLNEVSEELTEDPVSAAQLLEMLHSVPELPKPEFRIATELDDVPPLPTSPPPLKRHDEETHGFISASPLLSLINSNDKEFDSLEEIVDAVNEVDFRIMKNDVSITEQVTKSEVIYLEPEMVKTTELEVVKTPKPVVLESIEPEEPKTSGIFRAVAVEAAYSSDDCSTPVKEKRRNIGEIIAEDHERAVRKKLDSLVDKPEVTVYDMGVHQVEKQRNQLIKQQKVTVRKLEGWVSQEGDSHRTSPLKSASSIPDSLKPKGWKSPEPKVIRSPRGKSCTLLNQ